MRNCPGCRKFNTVIGSFVCRPNQRDHWVYSCWGCGGKFQADGAPVMSEAPVTLGDDRVVLSPGGERRKPLSPFEIRDRAGRTPPPRQYVPPANRYWEKPEPTAPAKHRERVDSDSPKPDLMLPDREQYIYNGYITSGTRLRKKRKRQAEEIAGQNPHSLDLNGVKPHLRMLIKGALLDQTLETLAKSHKKHLGILALSRPKRKD